MLLLKCFIKSECHCGRFSIDDQALPTTRARGRCSPRPIGRLLPDTPQRPIFRARVPDRDAEGDESTAVTRLERNANIAAVVIPFLGVIAAAVLLWNHFLGPRDLVIFAVMYLLTAVGVTVGYPPTAHPPRVPDARVAALHARDPRIDVAPGRRDRLGGRPPQAPHVHRRRGRPPQPARRPRRGPARDGQRACGTRTSAGCSRPTARRPRNGSRATSSRTRRCGASTGASR